MVLSLVAVVGLTFTRQVTEPVRRLENASRQLAEGDLTVRVPTNDGTPELRALAETFNITSHRLGRLVESQRRFVADASHQLRTPLTALRLRLETLAQDVPPGAQPKLDAAIAETNRLGLLVGSLLVLARSDAAGRDPAPTDLAAVLSERVDAWGLVAAEQDVELVSVPLSSTWVWAVPGGLEQIVDNLVSNALEVAPVGISVRIHVARADPWVELHVVDQGPGMSPQARAHAFERFWRAPGAGGGGFGLGLAIVYELVTASGGDAVLGPGPDEVGVDAMVRLAVAAGRVGPTVGSPGAVDGLYPTLTSD